MMKSTFLSLLTFLTIHAAVAQEESIADLIDKGIAMHDRGAYDSAIAVYDQIIEQDAGYYDAYEEKALSLESAGNHTACVEWCKLLLKRFKGKTVKPGVYVSYGTALEGMGKPDEALKIYSQGIKKYPDNYLLPLNKGITDFKLEKTEDASADFKAALINKPLHASSNLYLAYCVYDNNRVAAIMALTTFLIIEPQGERATQVLARLNRLLTSNVEKTGDKQINISLAPPSKGKKADDFHLTELSLSLTAALDYSEEKKDLTAAQKLKDKLALLPTGTDKKAKGFFTSFYVPFFTQMREKEYLETAAHIILASTEDDDNLQWLNNHADQVNAFYQWVDGYDWVK